MAATLDASLRLDSSQFTTGLDGAMKNTNAAVSKMSATFSMLKNIAIGGAIGSAFVSVAKDITSTYIEAEKLQNALKATAGNDFLGMQQYEQLKKLSSEIGLNMGVAAKATLQLQAAGMSAANAFKTIRTLQNAIGSGGGGSEELGRFIYGLQQLYASPKPLAEELGQLKEALPVTAKLLTQAFGSARAEDLQKLNLSGKQVAETLLKMAEAMPKLERGLGGQIDAIKAKFDTLKEMTGESSSGFTKMLAGGLSASLDYIIKKQNEIKANEEAVSLKFLGSSVSIEDEDQRKLLRALDRQKAAEADSLKAAEERKKLQEALDKGNQENRELDAIKWQNEERFNQEDAAKEKQTQDDAKKAADQAISDAKELLSLHEDTVRKIKSVQEAVYSAQQSMAGSDAEKLTNAQEALKAEGDVLMGDDPGGFDKLTVSAFEDAVKNGRNVTEGQVEQYNRIIGLKEEILGLEQSITDEAERGALELRDQNREAVQRSIEKAGRTPAERKQEMRDNNDMQRQRRRAFNDDVRDEMTRLKKEAEEKNKGRNILEREKTDREAFREQARKNITPKWADALPKEATLVDIRDILKNLAAA
jgi:tape measure domain-containing protein